MENRHLFRGKRIENGEWNGKWVAGHYYEFMGKSYIFEQPFTSGNLTYEVDPSTICQCTGYEGIYENDIFRYEDEDYVIKWSEDSLSWEALSLFTDESVSLAEFKPDYIDVIGNEIDNPIQNAMEQSRNVLAELMLITPKVFAAKRKSLGEYYSNLENCKKKIQACEVAIKALEEVQRWHTSVINPNIKNEFANTSTQICHNCDHKDEYIEELEAEVEQ